MIARHPAAAAEQGQGDRRVHGRRLRRQGGHDGRAVPGAAGLAHPAAGADDLGPAGVAGGAAPSGTRSSCATGPGRPRRHASPRSRSRSSATPAPTRTCRPGCCSPRPPAPCGPYRVPNAEHHLQRGVHQQRAGQRVPRVRRDAGRVRLRVADGRAGRAPRPVPHRAARAQLPGQGRPAADRGAARHLRGGRPDHAPRARAARRAAPGRPGRASDRPRHRLQPAPVRPDHLVPRPRLGLAEPAGRRHPADPLPASPTSAPGRRPACARSPPRCSARRWTTSASTSATARSTRRPAARSPPASCTCPATRCCMPPASCATGWRRWRPTCSASTPASWSSPTARAARVDAGADGVSVTLGGAGRRLRAAVPSAPRTCPPGGRRRRVRPARRAGRHIPRLHLRHARGRRGGRHRDRAGHRAVGYAACHDVGRAINPMRVQGQIQGGAMQGLGYALTEDMG